MKKNNYPGNKPVVLKAVALFLYCFLFSPLLFIAQSPGGVSAHLKLWFKADAGTSTVTDGETVNTWTDNVNGWITTSTAPPLYLVNSANYNPAVFYDRSTYHVLPQPIPILNSTVFMAGILEANSSADGLHDEWTTNDETDFPLRIKSGQLGHTGNTDQFVIYNWNRNEVSFAREHIFSNKDVSIAKQGSPVTTFPALAIGTGGYYYLGRDMNRPEGFGNISETFIYDNAVMDNADIQKIESYLALKYGLTLDNTGAAGGNYILSNGAIAWDASSYHHDVTGIARDNASALLQKQSREPDDSLRVLVGTMASNNQGNTGIITNDLAAVIIGRDVGPLHYDLSVSKPTGIAARFGRTWKITNTNFTDNYTLELQWDGTGVFDINNLRLLVSNSPDFFNAQVYDNNTVHFSNDSIVISGIGKNIIPVNSTQYFTIGAALPQGALPVGLTDFNAGVINNKTVDLQWQTKSEINNNYFTVQKSVDANLWTDLAQVKGLFVICRVADFI